MTAIILVYQLSGAHAWITKKISSCQQIIKPLTFATAVSPLHQTYAWEIQASTKCALFHSSSDERLQWSNNGSYKQMQLNVTIKDASNLF